MEPKQDKALRQWQGDMSHTGCGGLGECGGGVALRPSPVLACTVTEDEHKSSPLSHGIRTQGPLFVSS
ncbi:hypothetical protein E2C01_053677 [Portunus trituberculatus]|uniref:Uncharacterized protein n=1 Tax=Portunus trituberculatus TaxID=210409 RepID=A0A5B7GQ04_PORTR|nr:hypothetical protein [Portunus trituberculatus]